MVCVRLRFEWFVRKPSPAEHPPTSGVVGDSGGGRVCAATHFTVTGSTVGTAKGPHATGQCHVGKKSSGSRPYVQRSPDF